MSIRGIRGALVGCLLTASLSGWAAAEPPSTLSDVQAKLGQLQAWLATSPQAQGWNQYLLTEQLQAQLAAGAQADPVAVAQILNRYDSPQPGLERPKFVQVRQALKAWWQTLAPPAPDQLYAALESAKGAFVPLTEADLQNARRQLNDALQRLDARLQAAGQIGSDWRSFLHWDELQTELAKPTPDLTVLDSFYDRFSGGYNGLGWQMFTDVRDGLRRYLVVARAIGNEQLAQQYPKVLELLSKHLHSYNEAPNPQDAQQIGVALRWLREAQQAGWLVEAVRRAYWRPNLYAEISREVVEVAVGRPVDEVQPVQDCILGTAISGTGHTTGDVTVELARSNYYGAIDLVMLAATSTDTVGVNGPAKIFSTGVTKHASRKRLILNEFGLSSEPAATNAVTDNDIQCIDTNGRQLVERIAWRRASQQLPQAEQIAARHAEVRVNTRLDEQAAELLADANAQYQKQFRRPLEQRGLFPPMLTFSSTHDAVNVVALEAGATDLGAPSAPPALTAHADLGVRVHESMANNLAQGGLAGRNFQEEEVRKQVTDLLGYLPEQLKNPEEDGEPTAITFAQQQPISVAFGQDSFTVTIRGASFTKGETEYPGMTITVTYDVRQTAEGPRAVRRGDLQIFPPTFKPDSGQQLSGREQTIRRILQRRLERAFPQEIVPKPIEPKGRLANLGPLVLTEWRVANGWMLLGWQRSQATPTAAPTAQSSAEPTVAAK